MPETVVDGLEVVEVDVDHRDFRRATTAERVVDPVAEEGAVREPRERVVERLMGELVLELLLLGDVDHVAATRNRDAVRVVHDHGLVEEPPPAAVAGLEAVLDPERPARLEVDAVLGDRALAVVGVEQVDPPGRLRLPLLGAVAQDLLELRARVQRRCVDLEPVDIGNQRDRLDERAVLLAHRVGPGAIVHLLRDVEEDSLEHQAVRPGGRT